MGRESSGNMIFGSIRSVLVFLLEIHAIRFVLLLFMSLVYDTYTSGRLTNDKAIENEHWGFEC